MNTNGKKTRSKKRVINHQAQEVRRSDTYPLPLYQKLEAEQQELGYKSFNEYLIALLDERFETVEKMRYRRSLSRGN